MLVTGVGGQKGYSFYGAHNTAHNIAYIYLKYLGTFFFTQNSYFWPSLVL